MRILIRPRHGGIPDDLGAAELPTSKSFAQRALCLNEFLPSHYRLVNLPAARDVQVLRAALAAAPNTVLKLRDNGTAMRILAVLPAMLGEYRTLDGGERLRRRPLSAAVEFLRRYGGQVSEDWPRCFDGRAAEFPDELEVDASLTTQVATGVLLGAAARLVRYGVHHRVLVRRPTAPEYLLVTCQTLGQFGIVTAHRCEGDDFLVEIREWAAPRGTKRIEIPLDASGYAFLATLLALHGRPAEIIERPLDSHPDWRICDDLRQLLAAEPGAAVWFRDLHRRPDSFPCLVTIAALRAGTTTITGVPALRHKESDRIAAMARALEVLGVDCKELEDGLQVTGPLPAHTSPVELPAPDDHRIVMALALLGTCLPAGVVVPNVAAVEKSWPGYFDWLARIGEISPVPGGR